eukprot:1802721-Rhodomonas_salina.4
MPTAQQAVAAELEKARAERERAEQVQTALSACLVARVFRSPELTLSVWPSGAGGDAAAASFEPARLAGELLQPSTSVRVMLESAMLGSEPARGGGRCGSNPMGWGRRAWWCGTTGGSAARAWTKGRSACMRACRST